MTLKRYILRSFDWSTVHGKAAFYCAEPYAAGASYYANWTPYSWDATQYRTREDAEKILATCAQGKGTILEIDIIRVDCVCGILRDDCEYHAPRPTLPAMRGAP